MKLPAFSALELTSTRSALAPVPSLDWSRDGHVHTSWCLHASGSMEEYVLVALERGLTSLIFLEHFEAGINSPRRTWLTADDFTHYRAEGRRLRRRYAGQIEIGLGVEVGYNPRELKATKEFLAANSWDQVGISCHFLEIQGQHYNLLSSERQSLAAFDAYGVERALAAYFELLTEAVELLPGDVLCHFDAALRHHPEIAPALADQSARPELERIFQIMAAKGMALELNTSGFAHDRRQAYPSPMLLSRAAAYRLPLCLGSDAHQPKEVGRFFECLRLAGPDLAIHPEQALDQPLFHP